MFGQLLSDPLSFRLSDRLRLFSSVSRPTNDCDECDSDQHLDRLQRVKRLKHKQRNILPHWSQVFDCLKRMSTENKAEDMLSPLVSLCRRFESIGSDSAIDLVQSAVVYVLQLFYDSMYLKNKSDPKPEVLPLLNDMFGDNEIMDELVANAYHYSKPVLEILSDEDRERLFRPFKSSDTPSGYGSDKCLNLSQILNDCSDNENNWCKFDIKDIDMDPFEDRNETIVKWEALPDKTFDNQLTDEEIDRMSEQINTLKFNTMNTPFFRRDRSEVLDRSEYPFVFDASIDDRVTAAVIAGTKMILPSNFIRKDRNRWESVTIPAPAPPPQKLAAKLIDVNQELDDFCKIGFNGIKQLNRIQSMLFETAYNSTENMLICAPTGSGKTNVALLSILNMIRSNSLNGSVNDIDLEAFKVVYIAPMKALAV